MSFGAIRQAVGVKLPAETLQTKTTMSDGHLMIRGPVMERLRTTLGRF